LQESSLNSVPSHETKFTYALFLIKTNDRRLLVRGTELLQDLLQHDENNREYLYYVAIGFFKMEEFGTSRKYVLSLLQKGNNKHC